MLLSPLDFIVFISKRFWIFGLSSLMLAICHKEIILSKVTSYDIIDRWMGLPQVVIITSIIVIKALKYMLQIFCHTILIGIPSLFPWMLSLLSHHPKSILNLEAPLHKTCRQMKTPSSLTQGTSYHKMNEESCNEDDHYVLFKKLPEIANLATGSNTIFRTEFSWDNNMYWQAIMTL